MYKPLYPHVVTTLGEAAARLPHDLAPILEQALAAVNDARSLATVTCESCLQQRRGRQPQAD
ncbi:hypothetical protein [Stenotrophomonas maltophilia]|uniref:hypothetical protein n=1 Tax=Stenotrophomonas maltophilia TaxID=40324 RepID=UPI001EE44D52|nr:hypothetical protein [Stenotrophomonas maltophilia]